MSEERQLHIGTGDDMTIAQRIRNRRKELGMTQKELGELCGMADSAIRKYESGRITPKHQTLKRIADALQVPIYDLIEAKYPVVHGMWIKTEIGTVRCSICDSMVAIVFSEESLKEVRSENKYCYHCGAKMDGERKDKEETK